MATLSADEFLKEIISPKNKTFIDLAVLQEERLFLHAEPILEKYNLPFTSFRNFTVWWQSLISQVKQNRIDELLNCPMFTVGVVKDIFDQLQKFLDAQDRYIEFKFSDIDYTNDYSAYLKKINDDDFWRQNLINNLKTSICSYVVVDMPAVQTTERPEPYTYLISPRLIKCVDINRFTGNVEYISFFQSDLFWDAQMQTANSNASLQYLRDGEKAQKMIAIDDKTYRVFIKPINPKSQYLRKTDKDSGGWLLVSESSHDAGYCPVIDFWKDSIKGTNGINKCGPITLQLGNLDYILFFKACIDYMNLYGPFPLEVSYNVDKIEFDDKTKETNTGNNYNPSQTNLVSNSPQTQNPRTSGRNRIGPGGGMTYDVPEREGDFDPMSNGDPIRFVGMDVKSYQAANELLEGMECKIKEKCTGIDEDYLNEIAKNAEMLAASFRKEDTIMNWIAGNMERVHDFVTRTRCILRYGREYFLGCTIDYGSDRLLKDATTLTKEFKESVDNGMPQGYSFELARVAMITRFCNNPDKLALLQIYTDLDPYPTMSWTDIQLLGLNLADVENFKIKTNLNSFVKRFELEQKIDIVRFGSLISYSEKISIIQSKFKEYATQIKWTIAAPAGGTKPTS